HALSENLVAAGFPRSQDVASADAVFVYCETQGALEDAFFDTGGLVQAAKKGAYLITLCASTPTFASELAAVALVNDLHPIEAPLVVNDVSLAQAFADPANLSCLLAGEDGDLKAVRPLLAAIAATIEVTGKPGSAQLAKAALTIQSMSQLVASVEMGALLKASSADPHQAIGFAHAHGFITDAAYSLFAALSRESFEGRYTIELCMAELTAALMAADDIDLILPGAEACMHLLELLALIGGADLAPFALSLVYGEEDACAKQGLDWSRAKEAYAQGPDGDYGDDDYDDDDDDDRESGHNHDGFTGGFGSYSSN
ncbi:MAG: NAD(P)-binding domain-containing protein, partial [Eggerthellaceae bacterium]|nr:NAD(P)-binding domain-containing protein [Eggerthellaceae bacterium]